MPRGEREAFMRPTEAALQLSTAYGHLGKKKVTSGHRKSQEVMFLFLYKIF